MADHKSASEALKLDRSQFEREYEVRAIRLSKKLCNKYMKLLRGVVLARPKVKAVVNDKDDPDKRIILLDENINSLGDERVTEEMRNSLEADGSEEISFAMKEDYDLLSTEAILKRILPEGCEVPGSFETVGHIAHLNLKDELLSYKHVIGQVIMDKNKTIRTVVNKVGILENEYRVLPLEIIAGENNLEAVVNQHRARFKLNFAEVYWNSRLEEEHMRLVKSFKPGEVVADVMAGVGPFAIPAAQHGCKVFANDLNPRSYHYLQENINLNKVSGKVRASALDGRHFIRVLGGAQAERNTCESPDDAATEASRQHNGDAVLGRNGDPALTATVYDHAIMNLPATAVEFLDAFGGSFSAELWKGRRLPLVHVYTFARTAETDADIKRRVEQHLRGSLQESEVKIRLVRDVAPNKRMMCVDFRIPEQIAFTHKQLQDSEADAGPSCKKAKLTEVG